MNKKNIIILVIVGIILLIINFAISRVKPKEEVISLEKLTDEIKYFEVEDAINSFLNSIDSLDNKEILEYLNPKYISDKNIDENNVLDYVPQYNSPDYHAKKIEYKSVSNTTYYFVNGNIIDFNYESNVDYHKNVNYLVITSGNTFNLYPLESNNFDSFDISNISINQGMLLNRTTHDEESKMISYINEFLIIFSVDTPDAFTLLTEKEKMKYSSVDDFYNKFSVHYDNISTGINQVFKNDYNGSTIYTVIDDNKNEIVIVEESINNYKIEFEFE